MENSDLEKLLRESLAQFNVSDEAIKTLKEKLLSLFQRPDRKPSGAAVMTAEASMAADKARRGLGTPSDAKPRIV
jgi:hypothetical protein